jgi:uncharacterized protein (DUF2147 family)
MKKPIYTIILFFFTTFFYAQSVLGKWKTIDDETGQAKSIVEIYEKSGKIYGKIIEVLDPKNKDRVCEKCAGDEKNKPILGLNIIKGLAKDGEEYSAGTITDPKNGKVYKCTILLESKDKLKVRGYIGISAFGRSQYWVRVK